MSAIAVHPLDTLDEFAEAVRLEKEIWGFADAENVPSRLFVVAVEIGGQVFGAFDGERMVGFCLAFPGLKQDGARYMHSHMLGVLPEYRDRHVGRALKLEQRRDALARGIDLVEWTFDPLEIKNAWFNIERLGAVVRRYVPNQYGVWVDERYGGLPTDRCVAEWNLSSRWVECTLAGDRPRPHVEARIEVPADIGSLRRTSPERAREIQRKVAAGFAEHLGRGLTVIGIEKSADAGTYLLGRWESE